MRSKGLAVAGVVFTAFLILFLVLSTLSFLTGASSTRTTSYQGKDLARAGEDLLLNTSSEGLVPPVVIIRSASLSDVKVRLQVRCAGVLMEEDEGTTPFTMVLPQSSTGDYRLSIRILTEGADASDIIIEVQRTDLLAAGAFCLLSCFFFLFVPLLWVSSLTFLITAAFVRRREIKDGSVAQRAVQGNANVIWTDDRSYRGGGQ